MQRNRHLLIFLGTDLMTIPYEFMLIKNSSLFLVFSN